MRAGELVADRYRLDDRVDGGAMGDVWRGYDTRLDRIVAIKLLHSGLSGNASFRTRFQQEARSVAALQAPGVVSLYDYGEENTADGIVSYLIMELVKGQSLAATLRERGTLQPAETLRIVAAAADALHAAHQAGLVHRDVKPANMLIDENGNVKLVDFGIARARGEAGLTETGMVMGTVAYSSPEQLYDKNLTGAADLYSLGIVAYECLAGQPPFGSSNPGAVINGHLHQKPPPLPHNVPQPVVDLIFRTLEKDPARRWRSAAEMAQACRDVAAGNRTTAMMSAPPPPRPADSTRRMPAAGTTAMMRPPTGPNRRPPTGPNPRPRGWDSERDKTPETPEKSNRAMVILGVVTVLILITALVFILRPWSGDTPANTADNESTTLADRPTLDDDTTTADDGDEDDNDQGGYTEPESQDPTQEEQSPQDDGMVNMPNVTGQSQSSASATLYSQGFEDVEFDYNEEAGGTCNVAEQFPPAGQQTMKTDTVTLTLAGSSETCDLGNENEQ